MSLSASSTSPALGMVDRHLTAAHSRMALTGTMCVPSALSPQLGTARDPVLGLAQSERQAVGLPP